MQLTEFISGLRELPDGGKTLDVNDYVNSRVTYTPNLTSSSWQTANTTLAIGTGDCEDFSIAKRYLLVEGGINPKELSLIVCKENDNIHMVLMWNNKILNNTCTDIKECTDTDLIPIYAIDYNNNIHIVDNNWNFTKTKAKIDFVKLTVDR